MCSKERVGTNVMFSKNREYTESFHQSSETTSLKANGTNLTAQSGNSVFSCYCTLY